MRSSLMRLNQATVILPIISFVAVILSIVNVQSTLRRNLTLMQGGTFGRGKEASKTVLSSEASTWSDNNKKIEFR